MTPVVTAKKPAAGTATLPYTGREYLDSLDDGREIWIYGERVKKITEHPAFQNCARMIARLYDALHEDHNSGKHVLTHPTEWGGFTHRYFTAPTTLDEQVKGRDAIAEWARITYGWLGRSPDYKAAFLATLGANAEFYAPYQENARRWYRKSACPSSITRSSIRRSTATRRRARRRAGRTSIAG
jgi:4-hydroxyphenylacetate 3-monooxygenase